MFKTLQQRFKELPGAEFLRQSGFLFIVRSLGVLLQFVLTYSLTHLMLPEAYSEFAYVYSWIAVLLLFPVLGGDMSALRVLPPEVQKNAWNRMKGFALFNLQHTFLVSGIIACCVLGILWQSRSLSPSLAQACVTGLLLLPLLCLFQLSTAWLQAFQQVSLSYLLQFLGRPVMVLGCVLIVYTLVDALSASHVFLAMSLALLLLMALLLIRVPPEAFRNCLRAPVHLDASWLSLGISLSLVNGLLMIQARTDILMLGVLYDTALAGPYSVATQLAALISFGLLVTSALVSPTIRTRFDEERFEELQQNIRQAVVVGCALGLLVALPILLLPGFFLGLFHPSFVANASVLQLLALSSICSVFAGLPLPILVLCDQEKPAARILFYTTLLNIGINALCIPFWGAFGAALSTLLCTLVRSFCLIHLLQKTLGLRADVSLCVFLPTLKDTIKGTPDL